MSEQFNQAAADAFARSGLPTLSSSGVKRSRVQSLHDAVEQYDMIALRGLVITGAPLTEVDDLNCTPLHNAVEPDCPEEAALEMVKIMLASSPDEEERIEALCARSDEGLTPLHMVVKRGSVKLLDAMLSVIDEEIVEDVLEMKTHLTGSLFNGSWGKKQANGQIAELDVEHMTLLHMAFERLAPKEQGDDDEDPDNPTPPLSDAEKAETIAMIRQLIERGADVNARDANSRAPIHQAVEAGLHGMAELLLNAGADPTLGCKAIGMANNVLHQAVLRGDDQMAKTIIRCAPHLDVDAEGRTGLTALCLAARANKEACAKALVEAGADPKFVPSFGKSALDIARTNNRAGILRLFGDE